MSAQIMHWSFVLADEMCWKSASVMHGSGPVQPWSLRNGFTLGNSDVTFPDGHDADLPQHCRAISCSVGSHPAHGFPPPPAPRKNTCDLPVLNSSPIRGGLLTDWAPVRMCKIVEPSVVPLLLRMTVLLAWNKVTIAVLTLPTADTAVCCNREHDYMTPYTCRCP